MKRTVLALVLGITSACGPSTRGDNFGNDGGNGSGSGSGSGSGGDGCSASAKLIYTVDQGNVLYSFEPTTKTFTSLGTLDCPAGGNYNPFSMGVDRNAVAYVLYVDQDTFTGSVNGTKLFKVDTTSASLTCTATSFNAPSNLKEFGMGFSTTTAGGDVDQLFIAGGAAATTTTSAKLATLDVTTMATTAVGTVQGSPELTGNANGELWGFFPDANNPRIAQINKTTGVLATANLPASMQGNPMDWAFAFYGGDYYVFLQRDTDANTIVYQVSPTGTLVGQTNASGKHIVGAGVSTCAPVVIQ
ncbi:hypothetical protein BH11MYX1_BH11MYX1_17010 [soil metagenome]